MSSEQNPDRESQQERTGVYATGGPVVSKQAVERKLERLNVLIERTAEELDTLRRLRHDLLEELKVDVVLGEA
jgi:hypothetical protein